MYINFASSTRSDQISLLFVNILLLEQKTRIIRYLYSYFSYNMTGCQALERILTNFGKLIYDNVGAKSIGVDLSQQARYKMTKTFCCSII